MHIDDFQFRSENEKSMTRERRKIKIVSFTANIFLRVNIFKVLKLIYVFGVAACKSEYIFDNTFSRLYPVFNTEIRLVELTILFRSETVHEELKQNPILTGIGKERKFLMDITEYR